ncbi:AgmX/PglI C-terminal domain-containing protein [Geomonas oryzisoli]|uniref:AgmX/PglI C-terminal domain-containing protein n=1 Tax=Geomonas oryzisoli TaxID=2847992 RepID=UPI001EF0C2EB|nr:AgmX/PglI C-terminal domain-containing protein [Geomonas oryzisoli]
MNTSLLEQELAPLNAQVRQVKEALNDLEMQLRVTESELDMFSADRMRFDALRDACNAIDRLAELDGNHLFWEAVPEVKDSAARVAQMRSLIAAFDGEIHGVLETKARLKTQVDRRREELECLYDAIQDAHARDERREEEFLVERELFPLPEHILVMPWSNDGEVERRYRRAMSIAMLLSLILSVIVRVVTVPPPVHPVIAEVPERLAMMVRKETPKPPPPRKEQEKKETDKDPAKKEQASQKNEEKKQAEAQEERTQDRPKTAAVEQTAAPKRSQNTGMLAFKDSFKDLIDETPTPRLGAEARLNSANAAGQAVASRSLVTMQGGAGSGGGYAAVSQNVGNGGSGGIGNAAVGRNIGGGKEGRLGRGGAGFTQVKSGIAGAGGAKEGRPLSSNARAARTDEEIQILFDRYKAALYRIYNTQLRKDPTLRGKMVLKIAIEPSGVVSACSVESTNINATEFCEQIVDRVRKFNFGPKDGVPKTTILYPIDFLPAR